MMLKSSGKRGHPCFVPAFSGKVSIFSPLHLTLAESFFADIIYQVEKIVYGEFLAGLCVGFCQMFFFTLLINTEVSNTLWILFSHKINSRDVNKKCDGQQSIFQFTSYTKKLL